MADHRVTSNRMTTAEVADLLGIAPATWRAYVSRGQAPPPDGRHDARTPYWRRDTVEAWKASKLA